MAQMVASRSRRPPAMSRLPELSIRPGRPEPLPSSATIRSWRGPGGVILGRTAVAGEQCEIWLSGIGTYRFADTGAEVAGWPETAGAEFESTFWGDVAPFVLHRWGAEVLHASGVRSSAGVLGFCGDSHAGKSTLAAALQRRGLPPVADDALRFEVADGVASIVPLPFALNPRADSRTYLTGLAPLEPAGAGTRERVPLTALFVVEPLRRPDGAAPPSVERLLGARAVAELLDHAYCFEFVSRDRRTEMLGSYLGLASCTPVFRLAVPHRFDRLDVVLDRIVELVRSLESATA